MKHGFIKIAAVTPRLVLGDCGKNADNIIENAKAAAKMGAKLIVFPQLSLTGCTLGDLFLQETLLNSALTELDRVIEETSQLDAVLVVGLPLASDSGVYNCAAVLCKGHVCGVVPQLSSDGVFSGVPCADRTVWVKAGQLSIPLKRNNVFRCEPLCDFSFGIEIGKDATAVNPACSALAQGGANIIVNLAAEPEIMGAPQHRRGLCISQSARLKCTYVYVGAPVGESTGDAVYSGACLAAENGQMLAENSLYTENNVLITDADVGACRAIRRRSDFCCSDENTVYFTLDITDTKLDRVIPADPFYADSRECEAILDIQAAGLKRRLEHIQAKTAVIGISGGLDSTLALLAVVRAMDMLKKSRKDIIALTMPCFGTSQRTKSNAVRLCEELGVTLRTVDIKNAVLTHFEDISHDPENANVVYENAQARERTQILMDIANAENGIVVGTGDLSELALGFATYNGDHMSMYGINATIPKTLIRTLTVHCADTMGAETGRILRDIVDTPVSPELLPTENGDIAQKTEEIVGAYELHDFFIYYMFTYGFSPAKIYRMACRAFEGNYTCGEILSCMRTLYRRFFSQQYKRSCLPDGAQVTRVSFSPRTSWHMPSDACGAQWLKELDNIK